MGKDNSHTYHNLKKILYLTIINSLRNVKSLKMFVVSMINRFRVISFTINPNIKRIMQNNVLKLMHKQCIKTIHFNCLIFTKNNLKIMNANVRDAICVTVRDYINAFVKDATFFKIK